MVGLAKFETEKYFLETLDRIARNKSDYRVLYVNVSKLKPKNRHPKFVKIIARLFDDLVAVANGAMFVLVNGDFAILGKDITEKVVAEAVNKLRRGLITDPIWTAHSSSEFTQVYEPEEFDALADRIRELMKNDRPLDLLAYKYPVDAGQMDGLKAHLDEINIVDLIKHQSVLRLDGPGKFELLFEEFFVAVKDLSKKFDPNIDLTGNKWLFLYLTQTLDKKTMYSFMFSDIRDKPHKVSLNLNLSTIFLTEFEDFLRRVEEDGQKVVAEVQVMDILNNLAGYFDAKELLQTVYATGKRMYDAKLFGRGPFNQTEMQMIGEILANRERGKRIISSRLAEALGITRSAVSQMVNKLETKGVVRRVPDERDRKIAYIELSDKACAMYESFKEQVLGCLSKIVARMGEERVRHFMKEAQEFISVYDDVVHEMAQERPEGFILK